MHITFQKKKPPVAADGKKIKELNYVYSISRTVKPVNIFKREKNEPLQACGTY